MNTATVEYARIYEEQQPRLVAYARSLTRNAWAAEDLVAEAHFRVWRRLSAGHEIDNVPAYLMTTVRHLAAAAGTAARETPQDPQDPQNPERPEAGVRGDDPAEQVSSVDLLVRVLGQLPERWVKALWLAEAEGQPLAAIGPQIGTKQGATAVLLHRAREGMRQAFLRSQVGAPDDPACEVHWVRMPAYVRGAATARQSERLLGHVDACDDCRGRLAVLMRTNDRLPALVGPALLVLVLGGAGKFLLSFAAGSAGAATVVGGHGGGLAHAGRGAVSGGSRVPTTVVAVGTAVLAATAAIFIALVSIDPQTVPLERTPVAEAPVAEVPMAQPAEGGSGAGEVTDDRGTSAGARHSASDGDVAGTGTVVARARSAAQEQEQGTAGEEPETPVRETPVTEDPVTETPDSGSPQEETPGGEAPEAPAPAPQPVPPTPADPAPVEETPTPPETSDPTPADPATPAEPPTSADPTPHPEPSPPGHGCGH